MGVYACINRPKSSSIDPSFLLTPHRQSSCPLLDAAPQTKAAYIALSAKAMAATKKPKVLFIDIDAWSSQVCLHTYIHTCIHAYTHVYIHKKARQRVASLND